ncbi:polymorphic toxin type 35 domain-containing protein [Sphingobacterium faecium]|uniref:polymorphic toxin type 35 domain-containing protein n=1 Tax=Sphingobacterium faecium TaxID=34087 RepID=UPI0032084C5F
MIDPNGMAADTVKLQEVSILKDVHARKKISTGSISEVKEIMSKVLTSGKTLEYGNTAMGSSSKVMHYGGEISQGTTNNVAGKVVVSNAWVITDLIYKMNALKVLSK